MLEDIAIVVEMNLIDGNDLISNCLNASFSRWEIGLYL